MNAIGLLQRGNASNAGGAGDIGTYNVFFPQSVEACVATATLARNGGASPEDPPPGRITVAHTGGTAIFIRTFDQNGAPAQLPFNLIVAC